MKQHNKCFQWMLVFGFLVFANAENLAAQEQGRIIIIRDCPEFAWSLPDIWIINAKDRNELLQVIANGNEASIIAATEAEVLDTRNDMVVGVLYQVQNGDTTEKPWAGLGLYYIVLQGGKDSYYISKVKKNMGTEVILLNFSEFMPID